MLDFVPNFTPNSAPFQVGDKLVEYVKGNRQAEEIELKQLFSMYGMEVIATTGLGFESNIFSDPKSIFKDKVSHESIATPPFCGQLWRNVCK